MILCRSIAARPRPRLMTISSAAQERLQALMSRRPEALGVKVGVRRRGCNGLSYTMDYANEVGKLDEVVSEGCVKVVVDAKAVMFLVGTHMDFVTTDTKEEFVFTNPNAKGSCGCGESFTVA